MSQRQKLEFQPLSMGQPKSLLDAVGAKPGETVFVLEGHRNIGALERGIGTLLGSGEFPDETNTPVQVADPVRAAAEGLKRTLRASNGVYHPADEPEQRFAALKEEVHESAHWRSETFLGSPDQFGVMRTRRDPDQKKAAPTFAVTDRNLKDIESALRAEVAVGGLRGLREKITGRKASASEILEKLGGAQQA